MKRTTLALALAAALAANLAVSAPAGAASTCEADKPHPSGTGATYRICLPATWNGDLVVYAHGYVAPIVPAGTIPEDQLALPDGNTLPGIVNSLGFAFATTSYRKNGLAVQEGVEDIREVVRVFKQRFPTTKRVYLTGVSEGGLITALALERHPAEFSGGVTACGPIGDFQKQTNYFGDMRVAFDYFFPGILPPSPINVPQSAIANWPQLQGAIAQALAANPDKTRQLLAVTRSPIDRNVPATAGQTVIGALWYNIFATNDATAVLGGQPFSNQTRWYLGSANDLQLNIRVQRYSAAPAARANIASKYQTTGRLTKPMVSLHTSGDPIVPAWQQALYTVKALANGGGLHHTPIPIARYGHCTFTAEETLFAFGLLVFQVTGSLPNISPLLPNQAARVEYQKLISQHVK